MTEHEQARFIVEMHLGKDGQPNRFLVIDTAAPGGRKVVAGYGEFSAAIDHAAHLDQADQEEQR